MESVTRGGRYEAEHHVVSGFMRRYWMESMSLVPLDEDWWDRSMEFVAQIHDDGRLCGRALEDATGRYGGEEEMPAQPGLPGAGPAGG